MKWTHKINIRNKILMLKIQIIDRPRFQTGGICSKVPHTLSHVLFLDYDVIDYEWLIEELQTVQKEWNLSDFYIFQTREHGYHAICLDYFSLFELNQIILSTSCDYAFKVAPKFCEYRSWVLRTEKKGERERPVFVEIIESEYLNSRKQSSAHAEFLTKHYGVPVRRLTNPDQRHMVDGIHYLTANRVEKE